MVMNNRINLDKLVSVHLAFINEVLKMGFDVFVELKQLSHVLGLEISNGTFHLHD